jgi:hypothetical protein
MYLVAMFLIKQRKINFFNTRRNSNLHIIDFTILPNKSQIITLKAKGFNKSYLFVLQTNGETKLIDSKYVE